jgi:gliding motility-associated-like protein
MKNFTFYRYLMVFYLLLISVGAYAQRNYATSQQSGTTGLCALCSVSLGTDANAVDGNLQTSSVLNVTLGVTSAIYQDLIFPAVGGVPANTPVTVKLGSGNNLLDAALLGRITIRAYNGSNPIGGAVAIGTLVSAASGNNQSEISITPGQTYDRVRVTLNSGVLGAVSSINVYDAFYNNGNATVCNTAIDEIHGISSALLGLGLSVGGVANPGNAIDGDVTTASTLNAGVALVGSFAQQTVIYNQPSVLHDSVRITLAIPQSLLNASVLANISVLTYNGNISNNDALTFNSNLLSVSLLDLNGGNRKVVITFVPTSVFDRVQVRLGGGIASLLSTLNLYEIEHVIPSPVITVNNIPVTSTQICSGAQAVLSATTVANTTFKWYTTATSGIPVYTGAVYTTPALTANTIYYVEAVRNGCIDASARTAVTVNINPLPASPLVNGSAVNICSSQTATFTAQTISGVTVNWYTTATGGTPVFIGDAFTTPALNSTTSYYAEAVNGNGCSAAVRTQVTATVQQTPTIAILSPASIAINSGQTATITVSNPETGVTYNWYNTSSGGSIVHTGTSYTTPALIANTTYYVEGVAGACTTPSRAQITVTINASPDIAVTPPTQAINSGQTATMTASSTTSGATFDWYTTPTGGSSIFTGSTFTTPALTANTTYYAQAKDPITGAVSSTRAAGAVTINSGSGTFPDIAVTPPTQAVNTGQTATFTASSTTPGSTFNWYTTPTGGTPVFTGATFVTPPVNGNITYYAEATDPVSGNVSTTRATAVVTVNGAPDIAVTPPTQAINSGQTATMTASSTTAGAAFDWYTTPTGGSSIFTGSTFTTPALTANTTYYAQAKDPVTGAVSSTRAAGAVTINSGSGTFPDIAVTPPTQSVNTGQTATFTASSTTPGATFNWYTTPTGGTPVSTGATFVTPPVNGNITYYAEAADPVSGNVSTNRATAVVTVNGAPDIAVTPPTQAINSGQTATMTASSTTSGATFDWYTTPTGGSSIFTGSTFTTPALTANTTYYAQAKDPVTGATSSTRAAGAVTINSGSGIFPDIAVTPPTQAVNTGQTATFTASSTTPGATFNWYTTPTGGTPVFTGSTFITPSINGDITYYAEAKDPVSGNVSTTRATGIVTVNGGSGVIGPDIAVMPSNQSINSGQTATLTATSTTSGAVFNWYTTPTGGTSIFTGATFITPSLSADTIYYAEAKDPVSGALSPTRATGSITVNSSSGTLPDIAVTPPTQAVNIGQPATFTASSTTPGAIFQWYTSPSGGTPIFTGTTFTTPPVNGNITYYVDAKDPISGSVSATRATATVIANGAPSIAVTPPTQSINSGQTATFTATSTTSGAIFDWYATPTGGTSIFTGSTFTTPNLSANTAYYAEARDPVTGALSATRATGSVTINSTGGVLPDIAVTPPTQTIGTGQTATLTASSTTPGAVFNWYTSATGGTPIFTGATFTSPQLNGNITYYVDSKDPISGNVSATRAAGSVVVNGAPGIAVTPPTQAINSGQTATFTATSTTSGAVFNWFTTPTGGTSIFTGSTFTTPNLSANTTYYAEATDPVTGALSATRATGSVTINSTGGVSPDIAVSPPNQAVNAGQTAIFNASSTTPGAIFNWYTTPTGGTPVFTGSTFTTPPVNGDVTYYAEAKYPVSGGVSTTRATAKVTVNPAPNITVTPPTQAVNIGQTATFTASSTIPGATFNWYTTPTGGTSVFTGATFTTPAVNSNVTYYAEAKDPVTGAVSTTRASGDVTLNPTPSIAVTPPTQGVNPGQTATFTASSTTPGQIFNWYTTPTGGTPVFTGATFTTPPVNGNMVYYAEAKDPVTGAVSTTRATGTVTVNPAPSIAVTPPTQAVNPGQTATFTASSTTPGQLFNWYTTPTGGTPVFTGATFTTPPINGNVVYYAEAKDPVTGAVSTIRATGTVTVNPAPSIAITPPTQAVNPGQTAIFTASSTTPGQIFNWYTTPTGGTPVFTGPTFVTPPVNGNVIYYAEAKDPVSGAVSTTRATGAVTVNAAPDITVTPPTQKINAGQTATITASSTTPNAVFTWYTTPTGGTPIGTGAVFTTPALSENTIYYVEAKDPITGLLSIRATGAVTINAMPDISVSPPTRTINAGQTGTFTASSTTPGTIFNWYTTPTGGTPIYTGANFTTPVITGNVIYYVEAKDAVTGAVSATRATATITVSVTDNNVFVPNAFSPNNDGKNDILYVYGPDLKTIKLWVYDQWGELQFQSSNQQNGWDGTYKGRAQPVGVYVYYVEATTNEGNIIKKKGTITLLR